MRTDVTFELTNSGEANETKTVGEKEVGRDVDNNASIPVVPVFKGKPDKGGRKDDRNLWSVKPLDYPGSSGSNPGASGNNYGSNQGYQPDRSRGNENDDRWKQGPQYAIWTTERYHGKQHNPTVYHHRGESYSRN